MVDEDPPPVPVRGRLGDELLPLELQSLLGDIFPLVDDHNRQTASGRDRFRAGGGVSAGWEGVVAVVVAAGDGASSHHRDAAH